MEPPAPPAQHGLDGELAGEEHAPSVHGHHAVPVLWRRLHDGIQRDDAGVGHEHVYAPEALDGRTYHASRVFHDRDVPNDSLDLSTGSGQPLPQPRETGFVHVGDDEARLLPGEELGGCLSDTLRGSRDYSHFRATCRVPVLSPPSRYLLRRTRCGYDVPWRFGTNCPFVHNLSP